MLMFGSALANHNEFLGYHENFDEGAKSCYKAAALFGGLALLSALSFTVSAVRSKMSGPARPDYSAV